MFRVAATLVILAGELFLLFFAWKAWVTTVRAELPLWRNALSCVALVLLSLNWSGAVVLAVEVFVRQDASGVATVTAIMFTLSRPLVIAATALAVALRRYSRVEAVIAGLLMLAGLPLGYV